MQVSTALKLSEEDQATIAALKREIEKSWKLVDAAHDKARCMSPHALHAALIKPACVCAPAPQARNCDC